MIPYGGYRPELANAGMVDVHVGDVLRLILRGDLADDHPLPPEPFASFDDRVTGVVEDADDFIEADQGDLAEVVADQALALALVGGLLARQVRRRVELADTDPFVFDFFAHCGFFARRPVAS